MHDKKDTQLEISSGRLTVRIADQKPISIALAPLERIIIATPVQFSSQLLNRLASYNLSIVFLPNHQTHTACWILPSSHGDHQRRLQQHALCSDSQQQNALAYLIVRQKLLGQGELFNEAEEQLTPSEEEIAAEETITYTRKKTRRPSLAAELPREDVLHDLDEADKICDDCGHDLHRMGEEASEKLEFIPATVKVIRHIRPKYSCRCCEQKATQTTIKIASVPPAILPKSIATPTLLAQIITAKYQFGLPLYRQEALFKSFGIELHRQTMSRWLIKLGQQLQPLYDRMHHRLLEQPALWSDDTPVKVLDVDKSQCTMWVYGCGGLHPNNFLSGYTGLLQVDGYAGYHKTQATLVGCWAHARRKFMDAKAVQPKGKTGRADQALNLIQKLYGVEKQLSQATPEEKQKLCQSCSNSKPGWIKQHCKCHLKVPSVLPFSTH